MQSEQTGSFKHHLLMLKIQMTAILSVIVSLQGWNCSRSALHINTNIFSVLLNNVVMVGINVLRWSPDPDEDETDQFCVSETLSDGFNGSHLCHTHITSHLYRRWDLDSVTNTTSALAHFLSAPLFTDKKCIVLAIKGVKLCKCFTIDMNMLPWRNTAVKNPFYSLLFIPLFMKVFKKNLIKHERDSHIIIMIFTK